MAGIEGIDEGQLAKLVREVSDEDLAALMASEERGNLLGEIFGRMATHFRADQAVGLDAVVHFKILDRPDGGYDHYEVVVRDGACSVSEAPAAAPAVTIRIKPVDFLKLVTSNASGPMLFVRGRLKLDGDIMLASRLTGLFTIPRG